MSAEDDRYSSPADEDGDHGELARLNALHDDLVEAVQTAINPTVRADLAAELRSVRERIAELSISDGTPRRAPEPGQTVHSYELPAGADANGAVNAAYGSDASEPQYGAEQYPAEQYAPPTGEADAFDEAPSYGYQTPDFGSGSGPGGGPGYQGEPVGAQGRGPGPGYSSDPMWNRPGNPSADPRRQASVNTWTDTRSGFWSSRPWLPLVLAIAGGLVLAAVVGFGGIFGGDDNESATVASDETGEDPAGASSASAVVADIRSMLDGMGFPNVGVNELNGSVALSGSVATDADRQAVIGAASALVSGLPFDSSGLVVGGADGAATPSTVGPGDPASVMERELERILASTPIRFDEGQVAVTERHQAILNNVVATMAAYPEQSVVVVGYTDDQGAPEANEQLSAARAQNVSDYLVSQGVSSDRLQIRAVGEADATGAAGLANLERRVEFEVVGAAIAGGAQALRVGVVTPSASTDLAFSQSMVDALNLLAQERGIEVSVTDGTFVESDAAAALQGYAEQGYDLVVAHGSQFGASVQDLAAQFPDTAFAWGTASDTFGLSNVYAYDAKAQEGGYVLGAMAAMMSANGNVGVVGPIEVGDAALYINGFEQGATTERPGTTVQVEYIESFSDIGLAAQAATVHLDAGADILTGSAQMVVGAVDVAAIRGALWFGTQANQTSLAPDLVVASQVYHWEVVLRPILDDVAAGRLAGTSNSITLANQGLVIEYNDGYALPPEVRQRADQLVAEIGSGAVVPAG